MLNITEDKLATLQVKPKMPFTTSGITEKMRYKLNFCPLAVLLRRMALIMNSRVLSESPFADANIRMNILSCSMIGVCLDFLMC